MARDKYMEKMQVRHEYRKLWYTDLCNAPLADCPFVQIVSSRRSGECSDPSIYAQFRFPQGFEKEIIFAHAFEASNQHIMKLDYAHSEAIFYHRAHTLLYGLQWVSRPGISNMFYFHYSPPCASYLLRKRALYDDMSRYVCCAGYMPCSGNCGESSCPEFCLCTEVCCFFGNSVASTRFLLQDEFNIQTTGCDNCIIGFMICVQQIACIFSIIALIVGSDEISQGSEILNCVADYVYCTVSACMQTQHKVEMDKRDGLFAPRAMDVPPHQQMSRIDQPYPPTVGYGYPEPYPPPYPPQYPSQGYPPTGPYAPLPPGYPAAGHPPPTTKSSDP
ncbi:hypothetical protein V2J09_003177 [Rumex salicifolius]